MTRRFGKAKDQSLHDECKAADTSDSAAEAEHPDIGIRGVFRWLRSILLAEALNRIPFARFTACATPSINILMDAIYHGVCALYPARREYLQVRFDTDELRQIRSFKDGSSTEFGINIRELMSAVFATLVWGPLWVTLADQEAHVRVWIDNQAAVTWSNKRASRNPFSQLLLRVLSLFEVKYKFYLSAAHIPGVQNIMADAAGYGNPQRCGSGLLIFVMGGCRSKSQRVCGNSPQSGSVAASRSSR